MISFRPKTTGSVLIEVILAAGLFVILVSGTIGVVLQGFGLNRRSEEQNLATQYATEGLEAARSIRNQSYASLAYTAGSGLDNSGGTWVLAGSNNQFGPNNKFTRTIEVEPVYRDGSGNIVASGGSLDGKTKKVTASVTWNYSPTIADSVDLSTYLTNFRAPVGGTAVNQIFYGIGTTTPQVRTYDAGALTFSAASGTVAGGSPVTAVLKASPATDEMIAGYVTSGGTLYVLCFDGTTWSNEWNVSVGGTGNSRRFDIGYESSSGDVIVLYGTNASGSNELAYRTKVSTNGCGGGSWSGATSFDPTSTSGTIHWVKLAPDKRSGSNLLAALWADSNSDLSSAIWDGGALTNESNTHETSLEVVSTAQDIDDFDLEYESSSGDLMVVWANSAGNNGTNGGRYRTCTGGIAGCTWNAIGTISGLADDATNLDLAAHPTSDELVFASIGNAGDDLQAAYWSGAAWTGQANLDTTTSTIIGGSHKVAVGWLVTGGTSRSIIVYDDAGAARLDWAVGNGGTFTAQADFSPTPGIGSDQGTLVIETNPLDTSQLIVLLADQNNDLFAKNLSMTAAPAFTWTDTEGGAALTTSLPQNISYPATFAFHRNQ